jgi:hypothetical protein
MCVIDGGHGISSNMSFLRPTIDGDYEERERRSREGGGGREKKVVDHPIRVRV